MCPYVLSYNTAKGLNKKKSKEKVKLHLRVKLLHHPAIKVLYKVSLSPYWTFNAPHPDNVLTLLRKLCSVGTLYNIWT